MQIGIYQCNSEFSASGKLGNSEFSALGKFVGYMRIPH